MKLKKNIRERQIQEQFLKDGWEILSKGWPDFLLYKETTNEAIFIEVKRKKVRGTMRKTGLSSHQKRLHQILKNLGLNIKVTYL